MAWRRALIATERFLKDVYTMGDPGEQVLHNFANLHDIQRWESWSDKKHGGKSTAKFEPSPSTQGAAAFSGYFSTEISEDAKIKRSGFAGVSTPVTGEYTNLEGFSSLTYRIRGDGRIYIANLRTDNWLTGGNSDDVWQAPLFTRKGSEWEEIEIPLETFLMTHRGMVIPRDYEMHPGRVVSMGIALAAGGKEVQQPPGPFMLEIEWIKARSPSVR